MHLQYASITPSPFITTVQSDLSLLLLVPTLRASPSPTSDHLTLELMRTYNTNSATIYNTYQTYLKDSYTRLMV